MSQHPGFIAIGFVCLGLAGYALWSSPLPAQSNAPVNIYFGNPESAGPDSEMSFEEEDAPQNEDERNDSALPDESATIPI